VPLRRAIPLLASALLLIATAFATTGCEIERTPRPRVVDPDSAARVEIRATLDAWQEAVLSSSASGAAAFFDVNSRFYVPGMPDLTGPVAIQTALREAMREHVVTAIALDRDGIEVSRSGTAYEMGTFLASIRDGATTANGDDMVRGRYAIRWRRGPEGTWLIDTFLLSEAPPASDAG
jgi:ketosteroid isomerase-like protein